MYLQLGRKAFQATKWDTRNGGYESKEKELPTRTGDVPPSVFLLAPRALSTIEYVR